MPKSSTEPTRADLLADLARAYGTLPVQPDEITVDMLLAQGVCGNRSAATRILAQAVADGVLAEPVERAGPNAGRRLKAWRRLK